jgi:hypothetical protein
LFSITHTHTTLHALLALRPPQFASLFLFFFCSAPPFTAHCVQPPLLIRYLHCRFTADSLSVPYSLPIHCLFTAYSLPIHCLFTAYSLPIHCLFTAYSLLVHCLSTACPLLVHCLSTAYSLSIHCRFTVYSLPIHCLFTVCSLPIHCRLTASDHSSRRSSRMEIFVRSPHIGPHCARKSSQMQARLYSCLSLCSCHLSSRNTWM